MKQKQLKTDTQIIAVVLIVLCFAVIVSVAIILSSNDSDSGDESDNSHQSVSFPDVSIPDDNDYDFSSEHTIISDFESYMVNDNELIYSAISYPLMSSSSGYHYEKINGDIEQLAASYLDIKEHQKLLASEKYEHSIENAEVFVPFEYIFDLENVYVKGKFLSVLFSYSKTVSLSEPSSEYISLTYDLTTSERVDFSALIYQSANEAIDYILSIISQDIAINPKMYYTNALSELRSVINLEDIYLSKNGIVIFFNPDIITPRVYGVRTFLIPYDKLGY